MTNSGKAPWQEAVGSQIAGRYRVQALLGRGGMAAVYRVFDPQEQRAVALKCLLPGGAIRRLTEMLAREYRTLAQLSHPAVISVYEYGVSEQGPYYTMELLEGSDLHALAPLPWQLACAYLREVASCLALLHSRRLLHRDVSPRNVRCLSAREGDGAKLLDFGALSPMGPIQQLVGTPPLIPPEMLQRQDLDGRCDLYSLGGTLYWALTRHHAYPARTLGELPETWRRRPPPPSVYRPEVPEALDALVMSLLSHEPQARPRSAAEVMERLSQIAELPDDEHLHVSQSYLTTPSLVGRAAELACVREALERVRTASSEALWFEGESGIGRSRMLDAALLDARLAGAKALRVAASEALPGDLAFARQLLERLLELVPQRDDANSSRALLSAFDARRSLSQDLRERLIARLRALLRRACSKGVLVLACDDVDAVDPASQALLSGLLRAARRHLLLLFASRPGQALDPALLSFRSALAPRTLAPLSLADTEVLLSSVFGEVPGVPAVAARVHELSHGNPRAMMELAQHLVRTGLARYELGGWQLPQSLARDALPEAWTSAVDARLLGLSPDARALAELVAYSMPYALGSSDLDALAEDGDSQRRQLAVDELLVAGLVLLDAEHVRFVRGSDAERVRVLCDPARSRALHARIARVLVQRAADPIDIARCELLGGEKHAAVARLLAELARGSRWDTSPADYNWVLEMALDAVRELGRPKAERFQLLRELVKLGDHLGVREMPAHFEELLEQLRVDSGHTDYEALPDTLDPLERLQRAFAAAQARHDAQPVEQRVLPPAQAIQALAMTVRQAAAFGAVTMDYALIESLPSLEPFTPLSDALKVTVAYTIPAAAHLTAGRYERARDNYAKTLDRLLQPDHGGLDDEFWRWSICALRFALGHINAGLGIELALEYAQLLEGDDNWVIGAWDVRRAFHLRQGDWREAEACRDRIERLRLSSGRRPPMVDTSARLLLDTSAHGGDLLGVRRATERLGALIELHPGYRPYAHYGPAVCEYLRGNHEQALAHADEALALVAAGRHPTWPWIVSCRLETLLALGRAEQARVDGLRYLAEGEAVGLRIMLDHITLPLALAEAQLGDHESALARIDAGIRQRSALGSRGLNLGWAYEARARVAIAMRDHDAFVAAAAACAREYGRGRGGSTFAPKYEALRAEARQVGLLTASEAPPADAADPATTALTTLSATTSLEDRYSLALQLVVQSSGAEAGVLYRVGAAHSSSFERCATTPGTQEPDDADTLVSSVFTTELEDDVTADLDSVMLLDHSPPTGVRWLPAAFGYAEDDRYHRTGAALLRFAPGVEPQPLPLELVEAVGRLLGQTAG